MADEDGWRTCRRCGITWPIGDFYRSGRLKGGRDTVCCHCRREQARAYYASHHGCGTRYRARYHRHEPRQDSHEPDGVYRKLVELGERRTRDYLAHMDDKERR